MIKVLFVCTGNVFRSLIAKEFLKDYFIKNKIPGFEVDSAGIAPTPQEPQKATIKRLLYHNIKVNHKYKKITKDLVQKSNVIISMNTDHQKYIKEKFGVYAPLFNEIAYGKKEGILDFAEYNANLTNLNDIKNKELIQKYAYYVVDYIYKSIPDFFANINKFLPPELEE